MLDQLIATDGVREVAVHRSRIVVMALHGGLERATYPLAESIADALEASLYAVVQPEHVFWHIPSIRYDPEHSPRLRRLTDEADLAISLHGFGRRGLEDAVLLGGSNRSIATTLGRTMRSKGVRAIDELAAIPRGLRGMHRANPVNLPTHGGVQLELGGGVRQRPLTDRVVEAVVDVVSGIERIPPRGPAAGTG